MWVLGRFRIKTNHKFILFFISVCGFHFATATAACSLPSFLFISAVWCACVRWTLTFWCATLGFVWRAVVAPACAKWWWKPSVWAIRVSCIVLDGFDWTGQVRGKQEEIFGKRKRKKKEWRGREAELEIASREHISPIPSNNGLFDQAFSAALAAG